MKHRRQVPTPIAVTLGLFLFVFLWWLLAVQLHQPTLFPSPGRVFSRLFVDLSSASFWQAIGITFTEALGGCALAALMALPLSYVIYRSAFLSALIQPGLAASQAIPAIAIAPVLVIWVGYGISAIMVLCAIIVFFPILVNTTVGLRHVDREVIEAAHLDGAGAFILLRYIEAPLALPTILAGIRSGFTLSITGAVVGEFIMGGAGLGTRLSVQSAAVDMSGLFATIVVLCCLATTVYGVISYLELRSAQFLCINHSQRNSL